MNNESRNKLVGYDVKDALSLDTEEVCDLDHLPYELRLEVEEMIERVIAGEIDAIDDDPITRGLINSYMINELGLPLIEPEYDITSKDIYNLENSLYERFINNPERHKDVDIDFYDIWSPIADDEEVLMAVYAMEKAGHEPDIFNVTPNGFYIGTCSKETPIEGRDRMFNERARYEDFSTRASPHQFSFFKLTSFVNMPYLAISLGILKANI